MPKLTASSKTSQKDYELYTPETLDAVGYPDGPLYKRLRLSGSGKTLESPCVRYLSTHMSLAAGTSFQMTVSGRTCTALKNPPSRDPEESIRFPLQAYRAGLYGEGHIR